MLGVWMQEKYKDHMGREEVTVEEAPTCEARVSDNFLL